MRRIAVAVAVAALAVVYPHAAAHASTRCPTATSHLWCGLANNDGSYDRTYHWWEIGVCLFGCPEPTLKARS